MKINLNQIDVNLFKSDEDIIEDFINRICNIDKEESLLSSALDYHFKAGGSRSRANLTYKLSRNFLIPETISAYLSCIPELLHNASLIHDDLQDLDEYRREKASIWKKFGSDIAICAGDFLISASYSCVGMLDSKHTNMLLSTIHDHVSAVIKGQIDDLVQDKNQTLDDVSTYEIISAKKSGPLLAMCLTLPLIYSGRQSFVHYANTALEHYAVGYQIYDDIRDVAQDQAKTGVAAGVNIVTILQKNNHQNPTLAACDLALSHLSKAKAACLHLPLPSNAIIEAEISKMETKSKAIPIK
jgi:geranylgeranyl diphosphate synthase type II